VNEQAQPSPAPPEVQQQADPVSIFFEALAMAVGVETVFGEPISAGDRVIIPVAETAMGGGVGYGQGPTEQGQAPRAIRFAGGGGGGGGAHTRPVAAIVVTPEEVRVQPIVDVGKLALSGIASSAALWSGLAALVKTLSARRR
jgi:uncharacterized spore protein YtfJ